MSTYPSSNLGTQPSSRGMMSLEVKQDSSRDEEVSFNFGAGYLSQLVAEDSSFPRHSVFYGTDWPYNYDLLTSGDQMLNPENYDRQSSQGYWDGISEITPNGGNYIQPNWNEGFIQGHNELVSSQTHMVIGEGGATSSREVIVHSGGAYDHIHALDTYQISPPQKRIFGFVPAGRKYNRFTNEEVEELVQAVERLGTGRWQMIKDEVLLFRNDSRRTPTDLKDKWRTLVNTAILAAERRRSGAAIQEPLLQRVLKCSKPRIIQ